MVAPLSDACHLTVTPPGMFRRSSSVAPSLVPVTVTMLPETAALKPWLVIAVCKAATVCAMVIPAASSIATKILIRFVLFIEVR
ncbi:MAG: hypothetical protein LBU89_02965 [Fibromonadaceae bacterium]|nr:hypothetical protein [Fibromonadaceae bacterium]